MQYHDYFFWTNKHWYYHTHIVKQYTYHIPPKSTVLLIGCANDYLVTHVEDFFFTGIEFDSERYQQLKQRHPTKKIYSSLHEIEYHSFDYIVLVGILHEIKDIQELFEQLSHFCSPETRIIIDTYSYVWEPLLLLAQKWNICRPSKIHNWISRTDLFHFLHLTDFEIISTDRSCFMPFYVPLFSFLCNLIIPLLPFLQRFCLINWTIARLKKRNNTIQHTSVSIIIPCKNERGNIEPLIAQCPTLGTFTEIIFVEGGSSDQTFEEIKKQTQKYETKNIRYLQQQGRGKADAVHTGFNSATGDILMILDGDFTIHPQQLRKFYDALIFEHGEFINGSRLVYGMENDAMRFLNMIANHCFALFFSWLFHQRIKDTLCGTKVLFKKDYEKIKLNKNFFGTFDPFGDFDLLFGAAKLNLKIIDMPVHYKARSYGSTQIKRFQHGILLMYMSMIGFARFKLRVQATARESTFSWLHKRKKPLH